MSTDERRAAATRRCRVGCSSHAPARARAFVADAGLAWGLPALLIESAQLATSELVSNSVEHALSGVEITLGLDGRRLRIAVRDNSRVPPTHRPLRAADARGRGMALVDALADEWGVTPHDDGKTVWLWLTVQADDGSVFEGSHVAEVSERVTE